MSPRSARAGLAALVSLLLVAGCTNDPQTPVPEVTSGPAVARNVVQTAMPADPTVVVAAATAVELAIATSRALFTHAPAVVLVASGDEASLPRATTTAVDLGVPLLLTPAPAAEPPAANGALDEEVIRLDPRTMVTVGEQAATWARSDESPAPPAGRAEVAIGPGDGIALPAVTKAPALDQLTVLATNAPVDVAAIATARASGAHIITMGGVDPRAEDAAIMALAAAPPHNVLAIGADFGPADRLRQRVDTAATGVTLPGGNQVLFPGRRMVALYGHPGDAGLGSLGEQPLDAAVARAKQVAAQYSSLVDVPVVPAFELIATIASGSAGADGNYSTESSVDSLRPWVDTARAAGLYVVLDLQPGRTDFLTQAQQYADLLAQPNVGLALDPEWRLKPDQVHLEQIGSVTTDEINRTGAWLAAFTRERKLPQKVLMVHQFTLAMVTQRATLVTNYDELKVVIHADGFGGPGAKFNTWNGLHIDEPPGVWWGWKNFYDEDKPTFTPQQTVAIQPAPVFVSYQ